LRKTIDRTEAVDALVQLHLQLGRIKVKDLTSDGYEGNSDEEIMRDWITHAYGSASNQILAAF
jgi:hypothetical protein